jgi:hypothetical protein
VPGLTLLGPRDLPEHPPPAAPTSAFAFSSDQVEAARWLRDRSGPRDVVVTNRHCAVPDAPACDSRRFVVTAYTERRVLVEGWAYTPTWFESPTGPDGPAFRPFWDPELLALNDALFTDPSEEVVRRLVAHGARWAFVDRTAPASDRLGRHAELAHETEWAAVYRLPDPS